VATVGFIVKLTVVLDEKEALALIRDALAKKYPDMTVKMPVSDVFEYGDRFDRHIGHSFRIKADIVDKKSNANR
jgi:hypothetical protein